MKLLAIILGLSFSSIAIAQNELPGLFERGVYRGIAPTDESNVHVGEIQLEVKNGIARLKHATGLTIQEEEFELKTLRELSAAEVKKLGLHYGTRVFQGPNGYPRFFFDNNMITGPFFRFFGDPAISILTGGMRDHIAPIYLWSPTQVRFGQFESKVRRIEKFLNKKDGLPRIANGGIAKAKCEASFAQ